jgi:hypothetical protein
VFAIYHSDYLSLLCVFPITFTIIYSLLRFASHALEDVRLSEECCLLLVYFLRDYGEAALDPSHVISIVAVLWNLTTSGTFVSLLLCIELHFFHFFFFFSFFIFLLAVVALHFRFDLVSYS